jgi:hypothetical protein
MANIVICSDEEDDVKVMISALRQEHQVVFCNTASIDYNENYLSTFDLIIDHKNSNEARKGNPIRKSFDKGIPVLAGSPIYAGSGQGAAVRSLGISKDITYDISDMHRIINNTDVISGNYHGNFPVYDTKIYGFSVFCMYHGDSSTIKNMTPILVRNFFAGSSYRRLTVVCATFRKGDLNLYGEPFAADCAFLGFPFDVELTNEGMNILNDVIFWLLNKTYITAKVKDQDGSLLLSHDVYLHSRKSGDLIAKYKSDEHGEIIFRIRHKFDYYAVAFYSNGSVKNAIAIDTILA